MPHSRPLIVTGAVGTKFALLETLNRATPLIFTGLAVAVTTLVVSMEMFDTHV